MPLTSGHEATVPQPEPVDVVSLAVGMADALLEARATADVAGRSMTAQDIDLAAGRHLADRQVQALVPPFADALAAGLHPDVMDGMTKALCTFITAEMVRCALLVEYLARVAADVAGCTVPAVLRAMVEDFATNRDEGVMTNGR